MTTKQSAGQENVIRVKNATFQLTVNGKDIVLPRIDKSYLPRNDDVVNVYEDVDNKGPHTNYSFEDKKGELQAMFTEYKDGSMIVKYPGKEEVHVEATEMAVVRKNDLMMWTQDTKVADGVRVAEALAYPSGEKLTAIVAGSALVMPLAPEVGLTAAVMAASLGVKRACDKNPASNRKGDYNVSRIVNNKGRGGSYNG